MKSIGHLLSLHDISAVRIVRKLTTKQVRAAEQKVKKLDTTSFHWKIKFY